MRKAPSHSRAPGKWEPGNENTDHKVQDSNKITVVSIADEQCHCHPYILLVVF